MNNAKEQSFAQPNKYELLKVCVPEVRGQGAEPGFTHCNYV